MIPQNDVIKHLKRVEETFQNTENKSLTDILDSFRVVTEGYQEFTKDKQEFRYSSYNFNECTIQEKLAFANDQLQFIESLVTDKIYSNTGVVMNWFDIYKMLYDPVYAATDKTKRKVVFSTASSNRPVGDIAYGMWNGLQIIDLDIKDAELADKLKPVLFEEFKKYNWFLGVCKSASQKSLHVWTKISPISIELKNRRVEYFCNFRHKFSYVYIILVKYAKQFNYDPEIIKNFLDMAMAKPQQGIFISSDTALLNTNFRDLRLDVNFESAFDNGVESVDWIGHPALKDIFAKLEWFNNESFNKETNVEVENVYNLAERDNSKARGPRHYKHAQRWQLANTLNKLYGSEEAVKILIDICKDTPASELKGDVKTASLHDKPLSIWAVEELNKRHGFKIEIKGSDTYKEEINKIDEKIKNADVREDPLKTLNDNTKLVRLHLNKDQFLGHIKDDIIKNLAHITLLEAGAGYGKTEMIKALKARTLLILPFTSTIKAKIEADEATKDWLYYYGSKKPTLEELLSDKSMTMTIDKFSRLNVVELDTAGFEYIVIDESHLLFTSSYREVMSPCIQRLANCKAKVIMMTGTPTGEVIFFPNIAHIKVEKDDMRIKNFQLHLCPTKTEQTIEMCKSIARDIVDGKKILHPTNKGNLYFEQLIGVIKDELIRLGYTKELKHFYYKKSNTGEKSMDLVNNEKTFGDNNIIFCTSFLSVGVDICDKSTFSVYFNETWIPQDVEQFANRIRNNDLYVKMYLPKKKDGVPINYYYTEKLDLGFNKEELLTVRDFTRTCNDMLERNANEPKYNPMIQSMITTNKYLRYDENDCKYYIDETTYKLQIFEDRYNEYSKQLEVFLNGMKYYGYTVDIIDSNKEVTPQKREQFEEYLKSSRHIHYDEITRETQDFLNNITEENIEIYKELLKGNYDMFKGPEFENVRQEHKLWVKSIEIMEKNLPTIIALYKFYDCKTIRDIYDFCTDKKSNKINQTKLLKIRKFVNIEYNIKKSRLDFPIHKFVIGAQKFANEHPVTTQMEVDKWCADFTAKYVNSIEGLVVDDIKYFESMFKLTKDLWLVVIDQSRPSKGNIHISPFELIWERKDIMQDIYGNSETKEFFLQELIDNMEVDKDKKEEIQLPEFEAKNKLTLKDVEDTLKDIVHDPYEYDVYSQLDGSNDRFMAKQTNTERLRQRAAMAKRHEEEEKTVETSNQYDIFTDNDLFQDAI